MKKIFTCIICLFCLVQSQFVSAQEGPVQIVRGKVLDKQ